MTMLHANLIDHGRYSGADLDHLKEALLLVERTLNSDAFATAIMQFEGFSYQVRSCLGPIVTSSYQDQPRTNAELLADIRSGKRQHGADTFMELRVTWSSGDGGSAVGSTSAGLITTFIDDFRSMSPASRAGHLAHEWMHTKGYSHSHSRKCDKRRDCYSVPYAVGNIVSLLNGGKGARTCAYRTVVAALGGHRLD